VAPNEKQDQQKLADGLDGANVHLAFAWRETPEQWNVARVPIREPLTGQLRLLAKAVAVDLHDSRSEVAYDPEWPLNETQFFAIDNPTSGEPPAAVVGGDLFPQLSDFGGLSGYGNSRRRSNPNLYTILAQMQDGSTAKFGRRVTARHLLKASRWIRALWNGETFDALDEGPIFTLDPYIDWVEWRGMVIVIDAPGFHSTFRTLPQLQRAVTAHVDAITAKIGIRNKSDFVERCQSTPSMASKLESIISQGLYAKPIKELKDYSNRYPELGATWAGDDLVFDGSLQRQWAILRLLDEAGFTGELSGEKYEAAAKRHL
jgi:hypothetical protein